MKRIFLLGAGSSIGRSSVIFPSSAKMLKFESKLKSGNKVPKKEKAV